MPRHPSVSRTEVLRRMRDTFRTHGYDGATLSALTDSTGLARAALYHHFPQGKQQMAAAVLEDLRSWSLEHLLGALSVAPS